MENEARSQTPHEPKTTRARPSEEDRARRVRNQTSGTVVDPAYPAPLSVLQVHGARFAVHVRKFVGQALAVFRNALVFPGEGALFEADRVARSLGLDGAAALALVVGFDGSEKL